VVGQRLSAPHLVQHWPFGCRTPRMEFRSLDLALAASECDGPQAFTRSTRHPLPSGKSRRLVRILPCCPILLFNINIMGMSATIQRVRGNWFSPYTWMFLICQAARPDLRLVRSYRKPPSADGPLTRPVDLPTVRLARDWPCLQAQFSGREPCPCNPDRQPCLTFRPLVRFTSCDTAAIASWLP
jgi:hypothetical protein